LRAASFLLLFCAAIWFSSPGSAASKNNFWSLDLGFYGSNLKERFAAPDAYRSLVSNFYGTVGIRRGLHLGKRFYFEPSLSLFLPWRKGNDGTVMIFPAQLSFDFRIPIWRFLSGRVGPGIYGETYLSKGGEVTLNNGTSTSIFYMPNRPSFLYLFTVQGGLEAQLSKRLSLGVEVFVHDLASRLRRRFDATITVGIRL
jgi:hypothetical protein